MFRLEILKGLIEYPINVDWTLPKYKMRDLQTFGILSRCTHIGPTQDEAAGGKIDEKYMTANYG